jgi:foldase protein PrsA
MGTRRVAALALVATLSVFLSACGGGSRTGVAVRVGASVVTTAAFAHWMSIMAPRHVAPDPPRYAACVAAQRALRPSAPVAGLKEACRHQYRVLKRRVLDFLITSHWLIDEASEQGVEVSRREVDERHAQVRRSFSSAAQFAEAQRVIARTKRDLELEIAAQLASVKLRRMLIDRAPEVTAAQVSARYERDIKRFQNRERRYFYLVEALKSRAIADRLIREFQRGKSIASESFHEQLDRPRDLRAARKIVKVIFAARPGVLSKPVEINHLFFIAEVTRITAPSLRKLGQVQGSIRAKLTAERRERTLAEFIAQWRRRWIARTDCRPGYVVEKCRQFTGPRPREAPLSFAEQ